MRLFDAKSHPILAPRIVKCQSASAKLADSSGSRLCMRRMFDCSEQELNALVSWLELQRRRA
jgi:hypothetical protein